MKLHDSTYSFQSSSIVRIIKARNESWRSAIFRARKKASIERDKERYRLVQSIQIVVGHHLPMKVNTERVNI